MEGVRTVLSGRSGWGMMLDMGTMVKMVVYLLLSFTFLLVVSREDVGVSFNKFVHTF